MAHRGGKRREEGHACVKSLQQTRKRNKTENILNKGAIMNGAVSLPSIPRAVSPGETPLVAAQSPRVPYEYAPSTAPDVVPDGPTRRHKGMRAIGGRIAQRWEYRDTHMGGKFA